MPGFKFSVDASKFVTSMQSLQSQMVEAVEAKMIYLMTRLQEKAQAGTSGRVAASIRDPRAEVSGAVVTGKVTWGGAPTTVSWLGGKEYDIARILEEGSAKDQWAINPLAAGTPSHAKGGRGRAKLGARALASDEFGPVAYAFHPKLIPQRFMRNAIESMKDEISQELRKTVYGVFQGQGNQ